MARRKARSREPGDETNPELSKQAPHVQAEQNSIAVGGIDIRGNVTGSITIGHGYTAEQVSLLLTQITSEFQPTPFDGRCPYKGLEVFEEEDAELFFGRERLVADLLDRVKESRTVFITGPSGSGKSSLVRAGLLHALKQGKIKGGENWLYETMKPGREPLKELSLAFSRLKSPELANYFLAHAGEVDVLHQCAESVLSGRKDQRFVLFVDQFEETFTQIGGEEERQAFIRMLSHAATVENGRVIVLFAMRSDFVSNCATYPALNELLSQEFRQIGAMQPEELVAAIALPARQVGLPVEPELVAQIINDMKGEPGALPLMQFALKDLFDSQQEKGGVIALRLEDYLQHGGIHKSLERHADKSFASLNENEQQLARSVFSGLIEIGRGTQDTRRTALFDELIPAEARPEEIEVIIRKLADARLIITDEQAGKDTVTISHEKLIDAWPWLKKLVNENRDIIALQNEIASDAKEWDDHGRDPSYLYTGARLANAREQLGTKKLVLSGLAQEFVMAGQAQQRRSQRARVIGVAIPITLVIFAIILFSYVFSANAANQAKLSADFANTQQASASTSDALAEMAQNNQQLAYANQEEAQKQTTIALARQLAAQAQSINATRSSKQMIGALLSIQSMKLSLTDSAASYLLNNNLAARPIASVTHDGDVNSVAFSPDGKYVVSGSEDRTARVWETATGNEVARMTHDDQVTSVAFSLDGENVVSGSLDGTVRVWETTTGNEVARMTHDGQVYPVAFSPDGKYVVSGSLDGTARVWEASTGNEVARMTHDDLVTSVAFSPDGKYVVSGSWDDTARVWEATTGNEVARMTHDDTVFSVAFSPDGKYVVSGSSDITARVWETTTGNEVAHMIHNGGVFSAVFSPDGEYVVSGGGDSTARVWETATGNEVAHMIHDGQVNEVAFSLNGKYVVSGSSDSTARVWEATTGNEVARMTHDGQVYPVAFSLDGKYVVSGSEDGPARVWETATGKEVARMTHDGGVNLVAFSPDGKYVVSGSDDNTARVWEATTGKEVARMTHDNSVTSVSFSPDGEYVVSGSWDGTARVWETTTGKEVARMTHNGGVFSVVFSPDGEYVVSGGGDSTARVWETTTGNQVAHMIHDGQVHALAFSPEGEYIVSGSADYDNTARVWETTTGKEVARHNRFVSSVAFSPDGKYVVTGSEDGTARVWEASTGNEVAFMAHGGRVNEVTFSPDGHYVVSGSEDGTARVWEATTNNNEVALMIHDAQVSSVAFSPDGHYVVTGSEDGTARVWEASTGKEVARMTHDGLVTSVAFSPDSQYVVSGSEDGTARMWVWQSRVLIENACSYLSRNLTRDEWEQYIGDALPYEAICPNLPVEPDFTPTP